jgi:CheY-like chemotaxis protein
MKNTILWADDDSDDLLMMKEILEKNNRNYDIVEVPNGKAAIDYLEESKKTSKLPCLVILDINMPVLDGKEALTIIKRHEDFKHIPVVIFTTSSSELDKLFARKHKVELITKPPHYNSLEKAVLKMLEFCNL